MRRRDGAFAVIRLAGELLALILVPAVAYVVLVMLHVYING